MWGRGRIIESNRPLWKNPELRGIKGRIKKKEGEEEECCLMNQPPLSKGKEKKTDRAWGEEWGWQGWLILFFFFAQGMGGVKNVLVVLSGLFLLLFFLRFSSNLSLAWHGEQVDQRYVCRVCVDILWQWARVSSQPQAGGKVKVNVNVAGSILPMWVLMSLEVCVCVCVQVGVVRHQLVNTEVTSIQIRVSEG